MFTVNKYVLPLDKEEFIQEYVLRRAKTCLDIPNATAVVEQANNAWNAIQKVAPHDQEKDSIQ